MFMREILLNYHMVGLLLFSTANKFINYGCMSWLIWIVQSQQYLGIVFGETFHQKQLRILSLPKWSVQARWLTNDHFFHPFRYFHYIDIEWLWDHVGNSYQISVDDPSRPHMIANLMTFVEINYHNILNKDHLQFAHTLTNTKLPK